MRQFYERFSFSKKYNFIVLISNLIIFAIIFYFYELNFEAYILAVSIIIFIFMINLIISFTYYKKGIDKDRKIKELQAKLKILSENQTELYRDLEEYFVMWIHQIKTPITATKLILNNREDREISIQINEIENYTNLAMSYLRLKNVDKDLNFTNISIDKIINNIIKKYRWSFIDSKTQLIYKPIGVDVLTDANLSSIMIEQIINNALKYARGKTIEIYFEDKKLFIKDTGNGISDEDLPKIFNKGYSGFYGIANQKSSGLGLFIVKNIAKRLNQKLEVKSKIGEGTVFSIEFVRK